LRRCLKTASDGVGL